MFKDITIILFQSFDTLVQLEVEQFTRLYWQQRKLMLTLWWMVVFSCAWNLVIIISRRLFVHVSAEKILKLIYLSFITPVL